MVLLCAALQVLTSVWSDGSPGPIAFCVPEGKLTREEMTTWNRANLGRSYVLSSCTPSHFMSGETWAVLLEQLISPALQLQREKQLGEL